jgi:YbgC/YbaW family acyl-CoA thioester hydrolase
VAHEYRWQHRVEFAETDMAGIVHFSNYFRYMEMSEHAFLRSLGLAVHAESGGTVISWPRVRAECVYRAPLRFEECCQVHLLVRERTEKTITYAFRLLKEDDSLAAEGSVTVICVAIDRATKQMSAIPIPADVCERIQIAPAGWSGKPEGSKEK